jgi:hypothetical protein
MLMRKRGNMRRIAFVIVAIAGLTFGGLQILSASATNSTPAPVSPFATAEPPSGPEMPVERIEGIAQEQSEAAGEPHPSMKVGKGTLEAAMRTIDPSTTFPETGEGVHNMLQEAVTLAVLHGNFRLTNAHLRKGSDATPTGTVLDLVLDSHTGAVVGRALPVQEAEGGMTMATVASVPRTGLLVGRMGVGGGPARRGRPAKPGSPGPTLLVTGRHFSRKVVTATNGTFRIRLRPGHYTLRGLVGGYCPLVKVRVEAGRQTRTKVLCSIR